MAKFCGKCGSNLEDGAKFCLNCGAMVGEKKTNIVESEQRETQGIEKKKGKWGIIVAVVIVLLVLLVGIIVWILGRNNEPKNNSEVTETQEIENKQTATADTEDVENTEEEKETVVKTSEYYIGTKLQGRFEYDTYGHLVYEEYGDRSYIYEYEYTTEGNLIKSNYYDSEGNLCGEFKYNYDVNGNLIEKTGIIFGYENYEYYEYDVNGNLIEETWIGNGDEDYIYYEYDGDGKLNLKHQVTYDIDSGELKWGYYYYYAKNGMLTEELFYSYEFENYIIYNKQGDIISSKLYDVDGNLSREDKYEYIYDEYGNMTECHEISYNSNGEIEDESWDYYEYVYDEDGNILEKYEYDEAGTLGYNFHYTYY